MAARVAVQKAPASKTTKSPIIKKVVVRKPRKPRIIGTPDAELVASADSLKAYIPSPDVCKQYIGRKPFGGERWDFAIALEAIKFHDNMLLSGDTGSGKTLFGEAFASKERLMYYSVPCDVSVDPSALLGKMVVTSVQGVYKWQDGPVTELVRHGGVLNMSEINMMTPRIQAALYSLLDHRRYVVLLAHDGEIVRAHPNLLIIADMNPNYRGTMELNAAFLNRWAIKLPWGYSESVEEKLLQFPTLRSVASKLRALSGVEINTPVSTNLLMEFERFTLNDNLGLDFAVSNFVAAFRVEEQPPVEKVMEFHLAKFRSDVSYLTGKAIKVPDEDLEDIEFDFVNEES